MSDDNLVDLSVHRQSLSPEVGEEEEGVDEKKSESSLVPFLAASYIQGYWNGRSEERRMQYPLIFTLLVTNLITVFLLLM